eukprot:408413-Pyramimonas_sp.AAC.1
MVRNQRADAYHAKLRLIMHDATGHSLDDSPLSIGTRGGYISMTFRIQSRHPHNSELPMGPRANVVSTDSVLQTAGGPTKIWSLVNHA